MSNSMLAIKALTVADVSTVVLLLLRSTSFIDNYEKDAVAKPENKTTDMLAVYGIYFLSFAVVCFGTCFVFKKFVHEQSY